MTKHSSINSPALRAFQLKGSFLTLTTLELLTTDLSAIDSQLRSLTHQTPDLFKNMPIMIDAQKIKTSEGSLDFQALKNILEQQGFIPVGIKNPYAEPLPASKQAGLPYLPYGRKTVSQKNTTSPFSLAEGQDPDKNEAKKELPKHNTLMITAPVRSGQQIYAESGDLIILGNVSHGAEILADGHIHVYGTLYGRALAGVNGQADARIFCRKLEAELIAIAGIYWINEDMTTLLEGAANENSEKEKRPKASSFLQIYLKNDKLCLSFI